MMSVHAGAAARTTIVPVGTPMSGYAGRAGPSLGVHQATSARALVVDDVAIVALDVCAVHARTAARITAAVRSWVGTCVVTATHTHAGPCVAFGRVGGHAPAVHEALVHAAVGAVQAAAQARAPCEVTVARTNGVDLARNRRHPEREIDPPVWRVTLRARRGSVVGSLLSYPCHPVVLDAANRLIAADYPGELRAAVERAYPGSVCVFVTGAAGDVNTGHPPEASYTETGAGERSLSEADRVGLVIAAATLAATEHQVDVSGVRSARVPVRLPFARPDAAERAAQVRAWRSQRPTADPGLARVLQAWIEWAEAGVPDHPDPWTGHVTAVDLGVPLVFLPGEPFLATAEAIEARTGEPVLVAGYADDVPGYLPPSTEYPHGGYEVLDAHRYYGMPAPFAPGCAERVRDAAVRAIREVTAGSAG